jgi:hypothetical protein
MSNDQREWAVKHSFFFNRPLRSSHQEERFFCLPLERCGSQKASRLRQRIYIPPGTVTFLKAAFSLLSKNVSPFAFPP